MNEPYIILDFETTGFSADNDRVIEIGALKVEGKQIVDEFSTLVNPMRKISSTITSLTGITNDMVKEAPLREQAFKSLLSFVGNMPIVAHNASFDSRFFLKNVATIAPSIDPVFLCTMLLAKRAFYGLPSYKLDYLCGHFEIDGEVKHRAIDDAKVTLRLFEKICTQLKCNCRLSELRSSDLYSASKMPLQKFLAKGFQK